jgi:integrase
MNQQIEAVLRVRKPYVTSLTINNQARLIRCLYQALYPDDCFFDLDKLEATPIELICQYIDTKNIPTQKNIASAMVAIHRYPEYSDYIFKGNTEYQSRVANNIPTVREVDNAISTDDIELLGSTLSNQYNTLMDENIVVYTQDQQMLVRNYIVFCLVSGVYIAPRRNKDWFDFKIKNINTTVDNYIDGHEFVFNSYKTGKQKGQQRIPIPDDLYALLRVWISINPTDYLVPTKFGKQCHGSTFTDIVNSIFGVGKGTNMLRKAYLQNHFGNMVDLDNTMEAMGSSSSVINSYIKKL